MKKYALIFSALVLLAFAGHWLWPQTQLINQHEPLRELLAGKPKAKRWIRIEKSAYRLSLMQDTSTVKQYPVVFGGNPTDDKRQEGDQCTPEGSFKVRAKYPHKSWSKFIWIDYPNADSWRKFKAAKASGEIPQSAKIGGEIGIHGVPTGMDAVIPARYNWTLGCISMTHADVNELYPHVFVGMTIKIEK